MSQSKISTFLFAVGTCAIFFNPLHLSNEIYPYFVLSYLFGRNNVFVYLIPLLGISILLMWYMMDGEPRVIIDGLALSCSLSALVKFSGFSTVEKQKVCDIFIIFIYVNLGIILLQSLYEPVQSLTYNLFSGREPSAGLIALSRNNAVTGLAGEPAYASALLVGILSVILTQSRNGRLAAILAVTLSILFLKSITGIVFFTLVIGYWFVFEYNGLRSKFSVFLIGIPVLTVISYAIYIAYQSDVFERLISFIVMLSDGTSVKESEKTFGSARIGAVIDSFTKIMHFNYSTNYSLIGYLNIFLMSPLIPFSLFFTINRLGRGNFWKFMCGFGLATISGPILSWPLYWLLFENLKSKDRFMT
jgi:hypothetical protein